MKQPTTPFAIEMMNRPNAITREFLISQGWELVMERPLFEAFRHSKCPDTLKCQIGMYGEFSLSELHWCNGTPDRSFVTTNRNLTQQDYFTIVNLLGIKELTLADMAPQKDERMALNYAKQVFEGVLDGKYNLRLLKTEARGFLKYLNNDKEDSK